MSYTARDLITASLRVLGAVGTGETPSASEQNDALFSLNGMLDSWSIEGLVVPNSVRELITLVPGQAAYTMGPTGTPSLLTGRPIEIQNALIQLASSAPALELPVQIVNQDQFAAIRIKPVTSTIPMVLYAENSSPNETINLWPVPSVANVLVIYSMKALAQVANVSTVLSFPAGYQQALQFGLAKVLAAEYGKSLSPEAADLAAESKASIKRRNIQPELLQVDDSLLYKGRGFNIYTGGAR